MINKKRSGRAEGRLLEVLEKSPLETREPACQEFPACGGCMYQTMSYEAQKEMKECQVRELLDGAVRESLAKIGENSDVFSRTLRFNRINWMAVDGLHGEEHRFIAKIRYGHKGAPCTVREIGSDLAECVFDEPQRAITPGQAVVLYDGEYVAGGGTIL